MRKLIFILLWVPSLIFAQEKGIRFVEGLNWEQVKEKAKEENKFILIDCYTSWCGPCKVMEAKVFPNDTIGHLANEKFISVQVQFDEDKNADQVKKDWLTLSKKFDKDYNITGFPCILFFNPKGEIVHKVIGYKNVSAFKKILENVTDPKFQYYPVYASYQKDTNNTEALYQLIQIAREADEVKKGYIREYLKKTNGISSERNAKLILNMTNSSRDRTFPLLTTEQQKINQFLGVGKAEEQYRGIIYFEELQNTLGRKSPSGYYILRTDPDWKSIKDSLIKKYPDRIEEIMDFSKLKFFSDAFQWDKFIPALEAYRSKYAHSISDRMKIKYVNDVMAYSKNVGKSYLEPLLTWSETAFKNSQNPTDQMNFALLLYQTGKNKEAVAIMEEYIEKVPNYSQTIYPEYLKKMQMGETL
ncbi:thioredoxin family protein [Sphingobacterium daejeonense]|uniref:thioredoxin family protein n=1 Tax=Sphingobacterium daejeonense TaxID=371142 RepID=UPI0021A27AC7|nr:thioredoxin family protein [Sphingobacterium daejeonense]MCT1530361.1 thioredoxin family protein [Sphingobacterium daejeonense]